MLIEDSSMIYRGYKYDTLLFFQTKQAAYEQQGKLHRHKAIAYYISASKQTNPDEVAHRRGEAYHQDDYYSSGVHFPFSLPPEMTYEDSKKKSGKNLPPVLFAEFGDQQS